MIAMSQIRPTITFIMPIQEVQYFAIEQINALFNFSDQYDGFCEILILTDQTEEAWLKLAWLALKLNKLNYPHVRTRMIRYAARLSLPDLMETSISQAVGQRIVVVTDAAADIEETGIYDPMDRDILLMNYTLNLDALKKNLA